MSIILSGDLHGDYQAIKYGKFSSGDTLILLGDSGINYYKSPKNRKMKTELNSLGITIYVLQGNHECPHKDLLLTKDYGDYHMECEGANYFIVDNEFPNLRFMINGSIVDIENNHFLCLGGAYSVDKYHRLNNGWYWWENEQMSLEDMKSTEKVLSAIDYKVDYILSHTAPIEYEPTEVFLNFIDQSTVDKSMEKWLQTVHDRVEYNKWFLGHYHTDKCIDDKVHILYEKFIKI